MGMSLIIHHDGWGAYWGFIIHGFMKSDYGVIFQWMSLPLNDKD